MNSIKIQELEKLTDKQLCELRNLIFSWNGISQKPEPLLHLKSMKEWWSFDSSVEKEIIKRFVNKFK